MKPAPGYDAKPPRLPVRLLHWFCSPESRDEIAGDLEEHFHLKVAHEGRFRAILWFWAATLLFFRPTFLTRNPIPFSGPVMLKSNFLVAIRHLRRHVAFTSVNVFGLAVSMACCLLALLYVSDELAYDQFHEKRNRIYRVGTDLVSENGRTGRNSTVDWPVGRIIRERHESVESLIYMRRGPRKVTRDGTSTFHDVFYAEGAFTTMFDFRMPAGDPQTALVQPYTAVLSTSAARDLFGHGDVLGESIILEDSVQYTITGLVEVPRRSHIQFDVLLSFSTFAQRTPEFYNDGHWLDLNMINYLLVRENADHALLGAQLRTLLDEEIGDLLAGYGYEGSLTLEPLSDIYLRSDRGNLLGPTGNMTYVRLLGIIGMFILGVAAINFVNLTTARSLERAREVGVRKVVGATRTSLVRQFLTESLLLSLLAVLLAILLATAMLPAFNVLAGKDLDVTLLATPVFMTGSLALWLMTGLIAGWYPSLALTRFKTVSVLKGKAGTVQAGSLLRRGLVVFQFTVSVMLIVGTLIIYNQIQFMLDADVGFDRRQVVVLDVGHVEPDRFQASYEPFVASLENLAGVRSVATTNAVPGRNGWRSKIVWPEGMDHSQSLIVEVVTVSPSFVETMGLSLVAGRDLSSMAPGEAQNHVLINETAAVTMGWESLQEALGKSIDSPSGSVRHRVVGIVKDYHHHSLKERILPIVYVIEPMYSFVAVRMENANTGAMTDEFARIWNTHFPGYGYSHFYLDDDFDRQYHMERRSMHIISLFALIAVVISCLGLLGLAAYSTARRSREVGIRKVMGASPTGIVFLLSREFLLLVGLALLLGLPTALIMARQWLANFPTHISPGPGLILLTAGSAIAMAMLTVGIQAARAASVRPAELLRNE